jgi:glycosyltransferase involved in cell wall biosynthesis
MNILQICTKVPYPPKDGGASGIYVFSKTLAELGHSITILAANTPKHYIDEAAYLKIHRNIRIIAVDINTNIRFLPAIFNLFFSLLPYHASRFYSMQLKGKLKRVLYQTKFDIVQFEGIYTGLYLKEVRKYSSAKVVLRSHNIEYLLWHDIKNSEQNILKKIFLSVENIKLKYFEISLCRNVDAITSVTESDLYYLRKHTTVKSMVIPYGIEEDDFNTNDKRTLQDRSQFSLSYIGALDWIPNQEGLIWFIRSVWPLVNKEFPGLELHIAGRNAPKSLKSIFSSARNIHFHGEIDDAESFMLSHSAMVVPLFSGSGIRVKIIQALGCGVPVIASAKAIDGIQAEHEKHLLSADTLWEFVLNIQRLKSDKELYSRLSENGKELIKTKYCINSFIQDLVNFYQA